MTNPERWCVSVWVDGALRPVILEDYPTEDEAGKRAIDLREKIAFFGWTHKVHMGKVVYQA